MPTLSWLTRRPKVAKDDQLWVNVTQHGFIEATTPQVMRTTFYGQARHLVFIVCAFRQTACRAAIISHYQPHIQNARVSLEFPEGNRRG